MLHFLWQLSKYPTVELSFTTALCVQARFSAGDFGGAAGAVDASNGSAVRRRVSCDIDIFRIGGVRLKL
jgi:hypothetical protein